MCRTYIKRGGYDTSYNALARYTPHAGIQFDCKTVLHANAWHCSLCCMCHDRYGSTVLPTSVALHARKLGFAISKRNVGGEMSGAIHDNLAVSAGALQRTITSGIDLCVREAS